MSMDLILEGITFFIVVLLGIFIFFKNPTKSINKTFFIFCLTLAGWLFSGFLMTYQIHNSVNPYTTSKISMGFASFLAAALVSFSLSLTSNAKQNVTLRTNIILYSIAFFSFITALKGFYIKDIVIVHNVAIREFNKPIYLFTLYFFTCVFYAIFNLIKTYISSVSIAKKLQIKYVLLGIALAFTVGIFFSLILPILGFNNLFSIGHVGPAILAGFFAYAIVRHHLMGINIIIKKTATYSTVIALVTGGYLSIISIFDYVFQTLNGHSSAFGRIIAVIVIAIIFQPLRDKIEAFVDKIFFKTKYNYQQTLLTFSQTLTSILDLRELLDLISKVICTTLKTNKVSIMLQQQSGKSVYGVVSSVGLPQDCRQWQFTPESRLITWIEREKGIAFKESFCHQKPLPLYYFKIVAEMRLLKSAVAIPLFHKQELIGILNIGEKISGDIYSREDIELLHNLGNEAAVAISNAHLYNDLQKSYLQTIQALAQAIEANDEYTRGHSDRVTILAMEIAREMKIPREDMEKLRYACILHDVGKIAILKEVLNKPGKLSDSEFAVVKLHPVKGDEIIAPVGFLEGIRPAVRHHHERFDGKGYPDGLEKENIPLLARIIAVADTYDAMTSHRPYRPALSPDTAATELKRCSGTQFDPAVVDAFLNMYSKSPSESH